MLDKKTENALNDFVEVLKEKLERAYQKYGYTDDWSKAQWTKEECVSELCHHVMKGDPVDVAAYSMFCWARGWSTNLEFNSDGVNAE